MNRYLLSRSSLLLAALCFAVSTPVAGAGAPDPAGSWEGAVVITPGEHEFDLEVNLAKTPAGTWSGTVLTPAYSFDARPLKSVAVQGSTITLEDDWLYGLRTYRGTLSSDGRQITGNYLRGESGISPFVLERQDPQPRTMPFSPPVLDLSSDAKELKEAFNRDAGKERLIFILSPTSIPGNIRSRLVQREVLAKIKDPNLRVYILWSPMRPTDDRKAAEQATLHVPDPRVTHFWTKDQTVPNAFRPALGVEIVPWDVFLIYSAKATWGDTIPKPNALSHELEGLPADQRFNSTKLAVEVRKFLPASR